MMLDPLTHSRPTLKMGGESRHTFIVNGLSFSEFKPNVRPSSNKTPVYRYKFITNSDVYQSKFITLSTHSLKDKPKSGSSTTFYIDPLLDSAWVGRGSSIGFTVDKTPTHVKNDGWVGVGSNWPTQLTIIPTLKGGISESGWVPNLEVSQNG